MCHFRPTEITGPHGADPKAMPNGDCPQQRIEGTNVTKAELAEKQIKYLQVGGDWWNKCGDGWVNADAVFMRLPKSVVCEDWRTRRLVMRHLAEDRLPFPDNSIEFVYTEHMFEHILPMQCAAFLKEAYRVLKPGGVIR